MVVNKSLYIYSTVLTLELAREHGKIPKSIATDINADHDIMYHLQMSSTRAVTTRAPQT